MDLKKILPIILGVLFLGSALWIIGDKISLTLALTLVAILFTAGASIYGLKWWNDRETKKNALVLPPPPPPQQNQTTTTSPEEPSYNTSKKKLLFYCVVFYLALIATTFVLSISLTFPLWIIAIFFCAGHFYLSFNTVREDEHAIVFLFGKILFQVGSGPIIVPTPFFSLEKVTKGLILCEFGSPFTRKKSETETEEVPDEEGVRFVFRQPFRPQFLNIDTLQKKGPVDEGGFEEHLHLPEITMELADGLRDIPEHRQITPDLRFLFTFNVKDMIPFYMNVDGQTIEDKLLNVARLITDQSKAVISETAGQTTFGLFQAHQTRVNGRIRKRVEILLGEDKSFSDDEEEKKRQIDNYPYLGVDLKSIRMKDPGNPRRVNEAMADATAAGHQKQATIATSEGERQKLINEGEGRAEAHKAFLLAEAEGLIKVAETASNNPNAMEILRLKSLVESIKGGNVTLLPADLSTIASATAAVKGLLGNKTP